MRSLLESPKIHWPPFESPQDTANFVAGGLFAHCPRKHRRRASGRGEPVKTRRSSDSDNNTSEPPPAPPLGVAQVPFWELQILQSAFVKTMKYLCERPPEAAGILFSLRHDEGLVVDFVADDSGQGTGVSFRLDAASLNRVLKERKTLGQTCMGIVHSHPIGTTQPSLGDLMYFRKLFAAPANGGAQYFYVPIVCQERMYAYVFATGDIHPARLTVI